MPAELRIRDRTFWLLVTAWLIISPTAIGYLFYRIGQGWNPW